MHDNFYISNHPLPVFLVTNGGEILSRSPSALLLFPDAAHVTDLLDTGSLIRYEKTLKDGSTSKIELNLNTTAGLRLFDVYRHFFGNNRYIVYCIDKTEMMNDFKEQLTVLQENFHQFSQALLERNSELELSLKDSERMMLTREGLANLGKIAAGIAHEIRNPLTSIRGFVQLMQPSLQEAGKHIYTEVILSELDRINEIITEFLDASKEKELKKKPLSIRKVLKDIVLLYQSHGLLHNCNIAFVCPVEDAIVFADEKQLKQVLLNILKNAFEAIQESANAKQGKISISCSTTKKHCIISISDNGKGMDETTLQQIFSPFFTTKEHGNGIGLSVCKKIVELHSGTLTVESAKNFGTTFYVTLPLLPE